MSLFSGALGSDNAEPIPAEEFRVLDRLAQKVVQWRMAPVAIITLESFKPMNFVGSQGMVFLGPVFQPLLEVFFNYQDYEILRQAMERRQNVENLIQMIERYDSYASEYDRRVKKFMKLERKKWAWHQRWLGINQPKLTPSNEIAQFDWKSLGEKENREIFLKDSPDTTDTQNKK